MLLVAEDWKSDSLRAETIEAILLEPFNKSLLLVPEPSVFLDLIDSE